MCGIVGAVADRNVVPILLEGLKRLEYRGYDSAGIALLNEDQALQRRRVNGKVQELSNLVKQQPIAGKTGIAHTRWATHGIPSETNAHPHFAGDEIAVVHNGIIENHEQIRARLAEAGYKFSSDTDTELVALLIHFYLHSKQDLLHAVFSATDELAGAFALGIICHNEPQRVIAVRQGSPLVIGLGLGENFIASDCLALAPVTQQFIYLEEGDVADIHLNDVAIYDKQHHKVERKAQTLEVSYDMVERGPYRHFMQKEIFEQPKAIAATIEGRMNGDRVLEANFGPNASEIFDKVERICIVACGTSYHAGMVARYWLEEFAHIPCQVEIASEYRYRHAVLQANSLFITISQSGETADTLAALRLAKEQGYLSSLAICNVPESSLVRESELVFMTRAGVEIGVASTKAFTTQLVALLLLTLALGKRHHLAAKISAQLVQQLVELPHKIEQVLAIDSQIKALAPQFADKQHALFLGRGCEYPVALEGALKLKEISYIHAEGYPAGELKHGPLALVDKNMPVIAVAPNNELLEKLKSNLHEVQARGGKLIVFAESAVKLSNNDNIQIITIPVTSKMMAPIVYTIPLQLLAYHVALIKGTDVDQPRNLAKSVTVE